MGLVLYGERNFIGAVKFFDEIKDFGYISSNNNGMLTPNYNQDFYIDSSSFTDENIKKGGRIAIFQIEKQENGKIKAINIRKMTQSDDDIKLALSYYGKYELIADKRGNNVNLFNCLKIPRTLIGELVVQLIKNDKTRSPETTCEHFRFFVGHYNENSNTPSERYIFDRDFNREQKNIWDNIFSTLTDDEFCKILSIYPSVCKYAKNQIVLINWIHSLTIEEFSNSILQGVMNGLDCMAEDFSRDFRIALNEIINKKLDAIFKEIKNYNEIDERKLMKILEPYVKFLNDNQNEELSFLITKIRYNEFEDLIDLNMIYLNHITHC